MSGLQVEAVILPDGEQYKNLDVLSRVWDKALQMRLNRKCTFVALGGGVIGDMTGFAAASYQRGVNFVQVLLLPHNHAHLFGVASEDACIFRMAAPIS